MQGHIEKPNTEASTAVASEARSSDSTDIQRINRNSPCRSGELHLGTTTANISKPLSTNNNSNLQPQPLPATTNGKMPSSFLTNGSTSTNKIQQHEPGKQPPLQQSRRGSAYPADQCWGTGDAALRSSGHGNKTLVLCFDGTGNKFKGNSGDTNILKIFSMLDRRKGDQYHYYQREFITLYINTPPPLYRFLTNVYIYTIQPVSAPTSPPTP